MKQNPQQMNKLTSQQWLNGVACQVLWLSEYLIYKFYGFWVSWFASFMDVNLYRDSTLNMCYRLVGKSDSRSVTMESFNVLLVCISYHRWFISYIHLINMSVNLTLLCCYLEDTHYSPQLFKLFSLACQLSKLKLSFDEALNWL